MKREKVVPTNEIVEFTNMIGQLKSSGKKYKGKKKCQGPKRTHNFKRKNTKGKTN